MIKVCLCKPSWQRFIDRRFGDIASVAAIIAQVAFVQAYAADWAARPFRSAHSAGSSALFGDYAVIARRISDLICLAFLVSYAGLIYHGPGRVPPQAMGPSRVPPAVAAALGQGGTDTWCEECSSWKPVFASHCKACQRCCMWMDRHCFSAGTCIGHRNVRCYIVWLFYGITWCVYGGAACILGLLVDTPEDLWDWCLRAAWLVFLFYSYCEMEPMLYMIIHESAWFNKYNRRAEAHGWPTVQRKKFADVAMEGKDILTQASHLLQSDKGATVPADGATAFEQAQQQLKDAADELARVLRQLTCPSSNPSVSTTYVKGTIAQVAPRGRVDMKRLEFMFGAKLSPAWILPAVPGGKGDGLEPYDHSEALCALWAALRDAIPICREALGKFQELVPEQDFAPASMQMV